jgi:hypothetical protein
VGDPRDIVDIEGLRRAASEPAADPARGAVRPFLMIWFRCCTTYGRLPKSADGRRYEGRCPKCLARLTVPVGEKGTSRRMFEAG